MTYIWHFFELLFSQQYVRKYKHGLDIRSNTQMGIASAKRGVQASSPLLRGRAYFFFCFGPPFVGAPVTWALTGLRQPASNFASALVVPEPGSAADCER